MGGGGGGGDSEVTHRYAGYVEDAHKDLLNDGGSDNLSLSVFDCMNTAFNLSPYEHHIEPAVEEAFFGDGYAVQDFPSQYDMFGRFMGGMDVCDLWAYMYERVVHAPEIENSVSAHAALLDDDIESKVMPRFLAGMRDINSVMGSSFIIGKSIIENGRVKAVNDFQAKIRMHALDNATSMWGSHLDWNKAVITSYGNLATNYYNTKEAVDRTKLEYASKDIMWNLNLFEYGRAILGSLQGGGSTSTSGNEPSQAQKAIGGAMSGAASGAMIGSVVPGIGTAVGAAVGGVLGLGASFL